MELEYTCIGTPEMKPIHWNGHIKLLRITDPYEMEVTARHSSFHILCGRHKYGSFICIPNWNIGTELASLSDSFWNQERLTTYYPELSLVDVISIVDSLAVLNEYFFSGRSGVTCFFYCSSNVHCLNSRSFNVQNQKRII